MLFAREQQRALWFRQSCDSVKSVNVVQERNCNFILHFNLSESHYLSWRTKKRRLKVLRIFVHKNTIFPDIFSVCVFRAKMLFFSEPVLKSQMYKLKYIFCWDKPFRNTISCVISRLYGVRIPSMWYTVAKSYILRPYFNTVSACWFDLLLSD